MSSPTHEQTALKQATILNQTQSPFLRLPSELRNQIFDHVFVLPLVCIDVCFYGKTRAAIPPHSLSLLLTYPQLYHETAVLPYKSLMFSFCEPFDFSGFLEQRTQAQIAAI
ncbi:hypothetical protein Ptr902_11602 [Pyrenophora tritici-repentis]|nr:hypothetical protein Ptr902_11602 [Pyrenophora tritici-repentis]